MTVSFSSCVGFSYGGESTVVGNTSVKELPSQAQEECRRVVLFVNLGLLWCRLPFLPLPLPLPSLLPTLCSP